MYLGQALEYTCVLDVYPVFLLFLSCHGYCVVEANWGLGISYSLFRKNKKAVSPPPFYYLYFFCALFAHGPWAEKDSRMDARLSCKWLISSLGYDTVSTLRAQYPSFLVIYSHFFVPCFHTYFPLSCVGCV